MTTGTQRASRRQFLKAAALTAGVCAFPSLVPASALGKDGQIAPSNRIVFGCIGWGRISPGDVPALLNAPEAQFAALCEVDRSRGEAGKAQIEKIHAERAPSGAFKGVKVCNDFRDMMARKDIDAVVITVPDHWHALMTIAAAEAGKDIYCEKPLSLTVAEGRAMVGAVRRLGRVFQTGSQSRSLRTVQHACELVLNGRIGELRTIRVGLPVGMDFGVQPEMPVPKGFDYDLWLGPAPWAPYTEKRCHQHFRWIFDYSGGRVTDWGAHELDIAQWGMGMQNSGPIEIEGKGSFPKGGLATVPTTFDITYTYANGVKVFCSTSNPGGVRFEGTKGWIQTGHGGPFDSEPKSLVSSVIGPDETHVYRSKDHHLNFVECVKSRREPIAPVEVGHRTATVCHLGNIAMRLERKLKWDPEKETFPDDPEANRMLSRAMRAPWHL